MQDIQMAKHSLTPIKRYKNVVKEIKALIDSTRRLALEFYWTVGDKASSIGKPEYGANTIETFANDVGWDKSNIYSCMKFKQAYPSKESLKALIKKGITWTHVKALQSGDLTDDQRATLEQKVEDEKLGANELKRMVKKLVKGEEESTEKPITAQAVLNQIIKKCEKLISALGDYEPAVDAIKDLPKRLRPELEVLKEEAVVLMSQLVNTVTAVTGKKPA